MCVGLYRLDEEDSVPHSGSDVVKNSSMAVKPGQVHGTSAAFLVCRRFWPRGPGAHPHAARPAPRGGRGCLFLALPAADQPADRQKSSLRGPDALAWHHQPFVPPDQFIPIAEQSGAITGMGAWASGSALYRLRQLREQGYDQLSMAMNVSTIQFHVLTSSPPT